MTLPPNTPTPSSTNDPAEPQAPLVGRLAPSPSGLLHLGHARTFLLAYWHVRARGGSLRMRIEDLDGPRVDARFVDAALYDLEWLGLDWDGPVRLQSRGISRLNAALAQLLDAGRAYPCVCSRGDIRGAQSAPQQGAIEARYPGTCRQRFASFAEAERETGRPAGVRLIVPEGKLRIEDGVHGPSDWNVADEVGDFLIAKRDKAPAYQLAVVVDDAAQGVTEVLRGDDLLSSAARQWHVQEALGLAHPAWFHVPLVTDDQGRRLAKREADLSLAELRAGGTDPRAIVGWAAKSAGIALPERVRAAEVSRHFEILRLPRAAVRLDEVTLASLRDARG